MKDPEEIRLESLEQLGFGIPSMKNARVCKSCGGIASASQSYCRVCGNKLPEETVYEQYRSMHRICPACDTVLTDNYVFCPQCGRKQEINNHSTLQ